MPKSKLKTSYESPLAAEVREAIDVGPTEDVDVVTPQFEREPGSPEPQSPPSTPKEWEALKTLPKNSLKELGLRDFDGRLMLFPGEWYNYIPDGFEVEVVSGKTRNFKRGTDDDDIRFGCLAYGIPAIDGSKSED